MGACAAAANIVMSILLVRDYGLIGVAIGTLLPTAVIALGWKMPYAMRVLQISLREMLAKSLLPVLWPFLMTVGLLQTLLWKTQPSGLISVGCTAAAGLAAFFAIYLPFFSGDAERRFVGNAIAALTRRLRAVEQ
jgi:hypothetical protein